MATSSVIRTEFRSQLDNEDGFTVDELADVVRGRVSSAVEDRQALLDAADVLGASGGGPLEDRLRLLHASLESLLGDCE
ncbi:MAG: hypothetical protein ACRDQZ_25175 [Mycobacteriales bacterium]